MKRQICFNGLNDSKMHLKIRLTFHPTGKFKNIYKY